MCCCGGRFSYIQTRVVCSLAILYSMCALHPMDVKEKKKEKKGNLNILFRKKKKGSISVCVLSVFVEGKKQNKSYHRIFSYRQILPFLFIYLFFFRFIFILFGVCVCVCCLGSFFECVIAGVIETTPSADLDFNFQRLFLFSFSRMKNSFDNNHHFPSFPLLFLS